MQSLLLQCFSSYMVMVSRGYATRHYMQLVVGNSGK